MFENIILFVAGMAVYHFVKPYVVYLYKVIVEIYNNTKENTDNG